MLTLGVTSLGHDASVALVSDHDTILFAGHAERYSRVKNDGMVNKALLDDALGGKIPDQIVWYERPLLKKFRQAYAGQWSELSSISPKQHVKGLGLGSIPMAYVGHHESHAAGGYYTSKFDDAAVIVCDAIGEWDCVSVWEGRGLSLKKIWSQRYPHSLGLLYSAFTQRIGMKPNEEEYILMGMSAIGVPKYVDVIRSDFVEDDPVPNFRVKANVHRGIKYWRPDITDIENIASSIQFIAEEYLTRLVQWVRRKINSNNLVLSGGVALNCVANSKIAETRAFENIWIMPNPGDSGSSIGAIAAFHKKKMNWESPYLGYDINRPFDFGKATEALINGEVIAIANGRAEFGPRALGNRSLICDPRGRQMKDKVNAIKKRERFRPFAPVILEDMVNRYFEMPIRGAPSPYMQFVAKCKYPDLFPAICHFDNTSRVQTLSHRQNPVFYELLSRFHRLTGCPMLLNTSLNIKGEPLVNTWDDAIRFSKKYNVTVF